MRTAAHWIEMERPIFAVFVGLSIAVALSTAACTRTPSDTATPAPATVSPPPTIVPTAVSSAAIGTPTETEVPLEEDSGIFLVPVVINDAITLKFTIDSGASNVSIPADVVSTLIRAGTITEADFIGDQTAVLADGSTVPSPTFRIRSLKVGTLVLRNVTGSVSNARGSLLLGQSFLTRLTSWSFDNQHHFLNLKTSEAGAQAPADRMAAAESATVADAPQAVQGSIASPDSTDIGMAERAAIKNTLDYFAIWSAPDDADGQAVRRFFAGSVNFYGSVVDLDTLMQKNTQFCHRWPIRTYTIRPSTTTVQCDPAGACTVSGVLDWRAANGLTGKQSTGVAQFMFEFRDGLIDAEGGKVLSRSSS